MASENPVSPKAVYAGLVPLVVTIVLAVIDWLTGSGLLNTAPVWVGTLLASVAAFIGAYVKSDPRRGQAGPRPRSMG